MSVRDYSAAGTVFTLGALTVDDWGDTDPAITFEQVEDSTALTRGIGGSASKMDTITIPMNVTINVKPGGDQSKALNALRNSRQVIPGYFTQVGSGEVITLIDGVVKSKGSIGRASKSGVPDDQYMIEFNDSVEV